LIATEAASLAVIASTVHDYFLRPSEIEVVDRYAEIGLGQPIRHGRWIVRLDPPRQSTHALRIWNIESFSRSDDEAFLQTLTSISFNGDRRRLILCCVPTSVTFVVARLHVELITR